MVNKYELTRIIEEIAPAESAEAWDMSGWLIETKKKDVKKALLCLTVTKDIINQAINAGCDIIISHHPLFYIPLDFNQGIDIYCAHTNLDKAICGTTATLIKELGFKNAKSNGHDFLLFCDTNIKFSQLIEKLKPLSKNIRYTNPHNVEDINKIAFCAGSGSEFWHDAKEHGANILITGDLKFHTALDSEISIIDIGHFESEILVLEEMTRLLSKKIEIIKANENSPIKQINS